ncbi:MAG: hypothetical protein PHP50_00230 [Lachnospiraceae bacterium]|nr:hypothetical protein [Lachnospiraceae bacterium]
MMEHYVTRATIIPEIIKKIMEKYSMTSEEAMKAFYESSVGASLADDETGLYGQSPLYIFGLFMEEYEQNER